MPSAIALGKEGFALGKAFTECCTRLRAVGISLHGKVFFAECHMSGTRQRISRVPRRHSAKIYTRQNKNTKKPKNNSKFFFGEGRHRPAPVRPAPPAIEVAVFFEQNSRLMRPAIEVAVFFEQNSRLMWPAGFELTTSPSCVCCSTTALHCHLCLDSVIYPHILY